MNIIIEYLNRKPKRLDPYAFDIDFTEEELISLFTDINNGVPYDQMKLAPRIRNELASLFNDTMGRKRPLSAEDISFRLDDTQVSAAQGVKDVREFVRHTDSMTILRKDGSKLTISIKLGLLYKSDSRNPGCVSVESVEQFFGNKLL